MNNMALNYTIADDYRINTYITSNRQTGTPYGLSVVLRTRGWSMFMHHGVDRIARTRQNNLGWNREINVNIIRRIGSILALVSQVNTTKTVFITSSKITPKFVSQNTK